MVELRVSAKPTLSTTARPTNHAEASGKLKSFVAEVEKMVSANRPASKLQAGSVIVQPGGKVFSTITDALNSITDASLKKQYVVNIGPGTYNEVVTCKSWVFLSGSGPDQTIITAPAQPAQVSKGTVKGASNSAVQNCTVQANTGPFAAWTTAVDCQNAANFDVENCVLVATDSTNGTNLVGLALDYASGASGSVVYIAYTSVTANGGTQPIALLAAGGSFAQGTESKFVSENGSYDPVGGMAATYSKMIVDNCYVQGILYSLDLGDDTSSVTANQCELVGPVSEGVVVNN
jgi:pectin methylesterase-like acyl-CoA thioesterase